MSFGAPAIITKASTTPGWMTSGFDDSEEVGLRGCVKLERCPSYPACDLCHSGPGMQIGRGFYRVALTGFSDDTPFELTIAHLAGTQPGQIC